MKTIVSLLVAPIALIAAGAFAQSIGSASDVESALRAAGYSEVRDIEFDGGLWEVDVRRPDGSWADVEVDPATGEIFDSRDGRPVLDARAVTDVLVAAGYTDITDLDRDGALWEADARDPQGQRVELRLSGIDGRVLNSDPDYDD